MRIGTGFIELWDYTSSKRYFGTPRSYGIRSKVPPLPLYSCSSLEYFFAEYNCKSLELFSNGDYVFLKALSKKILSMFFQ